MTALFRIGARGSPLSLAQTAHVQGLLARALGVGLDSLPITPITTTGDKITDRRLIEAGGKGLFTKELDEALLDGRIDLAVHSLKDLPTRLPAGIVFACTPEREDPRDAFVSSKARRLEDLPHGAILGTASLRRQAQALHARPDLKIVTLRGNVGTRLAKIEAGEVDATFLAVAGLKRLGKDDCVASVVDPEAMPPAAGQGALAITAREDDARVLRALADLEDHDVRLEVEAERGVLVALDGSCRTPIGAYARSRSGILSLLAETLTPDGAQRWRKAGSVAAPDVEAAHDLGLELGFAIRAEAGATLTRDV